MLKKHIIATCLFLAYTIVFAHSVVPHHHHNEEPATGQTAHHHHHDNDDQDEDAGLAHSFSHYAHQSNTTNVQQQSGFKISVNAIASVYILTHYTFVIQSTENPPLLAQLRNDHIPVPRHSLSPKGLRAPPFHLA